MNIFKCSLTALLLSCGLNAGYVLEAPGNASINTRIVVRDGMLAVFDAPIVGVVLRQDDLLGPNDLVIRVAGDLNIGGFQIATIGGNIRIEATGTITNRAFLFANAGHIDVIAGTGMDARGTIYEAAGRINVVARAGEIDLDPIPHDIVLIRTLGGQFIQDAFPLVRANANVATQGPENSNSQQHTPDVWLRAVMDGDTALLMILNRQQVPGVAHLDAAGNNLWLTAAEWGQVGALGWLLTNQIPGQNATNRFGNNLWLAAAENNRADVLAWLNQNNIPGRDTVNARGRNMRQLAEAEDANQAIAWIDEHIPQRAAAITIGVGRSASTISN